MSKKQVASEADIKKLYDPDFFYEHGDNPANKHFMEMVGQNLNNGDAPDFRSYIVDNRQRWFMFKSIDELMERDFKCNTFPRTLCVWAAFTGITL